MPEKLDKSYSWAELQHLTHSTAFHPFGPLGRSYRVAYRSPNQLVVALCSARVGSGITVTKGQGVLITRTEIKVTGKKHEESAITSPIAEPTSSKVVEEKIPLPEPESPRPNSLADLRSRMTIPEKKEGIILPVPSRFPITDVGDFTVSRATLLHDDIRRWKEYSGQPFIHFCNGIGFPLQVYILLPFTDDLYGERIRADVTFGIWDQLGEGYLMEVYLHEQSFFIKVGDIPQVILQRRYKAFCIGICICLFGLLRAHRLKTLIEANT